MARTHGTVSCYANGCRCDDCREAARLYRRAIKGSWRPAKRLPADERAWMETEPEYFHDRLRARP